MKLSDRTPAAKSPTWAPLTFLQVKDRQQIRYSTLPAETGIALSTYSFQSRRSKNPLTYPERISIIPSPHESAKKLPWPPQRTPRLSNSQRRTRFALSTSQMGGLRLNQSSERRTSWESSNSTKSTACLDQPNLLKRAFFNDRTVQPNPHAEH